MNQILFGIIGFLMFAITGIGIAEVRIQHERGSSDDSAQFASPSGDDKGGEKEGESVLEKMASDSLPIPTTVPEALKQATQKVEAGLFSGWNDDGTSDQRKGRDEDENEDEDDDDDRDDYTSKSSTKASAQNSGTVNVTPSVNTVNTPEPTHTGTAFTMSQVASHNSAASCYTVIEGSVYDVTSYISRHPGGQSAIKSICGVDGSGAFGGQHSGESKPASTLAPFKIGIVQ